MHVTVVHAGKGTEVGLEEDLHDMQVQHLAVHVQRILDVPTHKQKLIMKGKVLEPGKSLAEYGVRDGSKIMLLASGTASQVSETHRAQMRTSHPGRLLAHMLQWALHASIGLSAPMQ